MKRGQIPGFVFIEIYGTAFTPTCYSHLNVTIGRGQGLGQLLIGAPRLMLLADKCGVVGAALEQSAGDAVLAQALRCNYLSHQLGDRAARQM